MLIYQEKVKMSEGMNLHLSVFPESRTAIIALEHEGLFSSAHLSYEDLERVAQIIPIALVGGEQVLKEAQAKVEAGHGG